MPITSITIYDASNNLQPVSFTGKINIAGISNAKDQLISIDMSLSNYILLYAADTIIQDYSLNKYITTINGVLTLTGTIQLLGSACNSLVTYAGSDDIIARLLHSDSVFNSPTIIYVPAMPGTVFDSESGSIIDQNNMHTIKLFDGCGPCKDCNTVWLLQNRLRDCQLWINGMKDCILRDQVPANGLWAQMKLIRDYQYADSLSRSHALDKVPSAVYNQVFDYNAIGLSDSLTRKALFNCQSSRTALDHKTEYNRAVNLFKQYKTLVAMWNYLTLQVSAKVQITLAMLDYSGISVCVKKVVNICPGPDMPSVIRLRIYAYVLEGQQTTSPATLPVTIPYPIGSSLSGLGLCCSVISSNTYAGDDASVVVPCTIYAFRGYCVALYIYNIMDEQIQVLSGQTTLSAGLKIFPIYLKKDEYSSEASTNILLSTYTDKRLFKTHLLTVDQTKINKWRIKLVWQSLPNQPDISFQLPYNPVTPLGYTAWTQAASQDNFIYSTAYTRYNLLSESETS